MCVISSVVDFPKFTIDDLWPFCIGLYQMYHTRHSWWWELVFNKQMEVVVCAQISDTLHPRCITFGLCMVLRAFQILGGITCANQHQNQEQELIGLCLYDFSITVSHINTLMRIMWKMQELSVCNTDSVNYIQSPLYIHWSLLCPHIFLDAVYKQIINYIMDRCITAGQTSNIHKSSKFYRNKFQPKK